MRVLIVGATGFLGDALLPLVPSSWEVVATGCRRAPARGGRLLDLTDPFALPSLLLEFAPDAVLFLAYDRKALDETVVRPAAQLADWSQKRFERRLIYVSTDLVFSGGAQEYDEDAPQSPLMPYGAAKATAENHIGAWGAVVRTSLL